MSDYQAIPTEYDGVLFRSKTEAIFARAMTLSNIWWAYEPEEWRHVQSGWIPDFKLAYRTWRREKREWGIVVSCVELKPSPPTAAYLDRIHRILDAMQDRFYWVAELMVIGNPFDPESPRKLLNHHQGVWQEVDGKILRTFFGSWDEAMQYRFDLKH